MKRLFLIFAVLLTASITQAQWEDDIRLTDTPDSSMLFYGMTHNLAASGDTVHVVWIETYDGNAEIFYKRSTDGGLNWGQDTRITDDEAKPGNPAISLSGPVVHVVWTDRRDGNNEIYYNRSVDGGTNWEEELRLSDDPYWSYEAIVSSAGSSVHVIWVNANIEEGYYHINYRHSPDGGITWEPAKWMAGFEWHSFNPSIAVNGSDVHVVWNDDRDGNLEIYYIKSSNNGSTWGPEIRLTNDPALSNLPSVAVSGSNVYIVWQDFRDGNDAEIYYKGSADGGTNWGEDTRITFDPANSISPNLAVSNSVLHLVWQDNRNGVYDIFYNYSTDGGETWAADTQLNNFSFSSERPFIAVSDPVLHVVWHDYRDFNYEIYYKRNPTGGVFVGIPEIEMQKYIYPNPASRQLIVGQSAVSGQRSAVRLSIIDLYGRDIKEFGNISSFPCQLDISDLRDGVYFLRINDEEGVSNSVKFLKIDE